MITHMPCLPSKVSLVIALLGKVDCATSLVEAEALLPVATAVDKDVCVEVKIEVDVDIKALSNESAPYVNANGSHLQQ
jgi:hypothetical protein